LIKRKFSYLALLVLSLLAMNAWSVGTISFTSDRAGNLDVYTIDTNGENLINLTNHVADDYSPTWSPDGRFVAYVSERDGNPEIYVMELNTKEQRRLTNHKATDLDPAWSPNRRTIAFASNQARDHAADTDIYTMDVNGKKVQRLTNKGGNNSTPTWSPDGEWIAFRSTLDGIGGIHVMTADGEKQRALTQVSATFPTWSPNGKQICFSSEKLAGVATLTLFTMDTDGKNVQKLTDGTLASEEPSWAPDGRSIVYVSMVDGSQTLHVINVAGGEPRQLTDHLGLDFSPEWAPMAFPVAPGSSTRLIQWGFLKQSINTWKDYRK
jgi:TolB protein